MELIFFGLSLLLAITIHEFSHAYLADRLGDPTPRIQGRITLNPLAHLDPLGALMLFLVHFGWGKPVVFDPFNLKNPRQDTMLISLAGPASNLLMALVSSLILRSLPNLSQFLPGALVLFLVTLGIFLHQLIIINISLAVFNLLPIFPLDGFKVVEGILPPSQASEWEQLQSLGPLILLFTLFWPIAQGKTLVEIFMQPLMRFFLNLFLPTPVFPIMQTI